MRYKEPTTEQLELWKKWVAERPPAVRAIAEQLEPWSLYRLKTTGHRVTVCAFDVESDGRVTVRVNVTAEFNLVGFERTVFGINPDDLEPCELPSDDEVTGMHVNVAALTPSERERFFDDLRRRMPTK